MDALAESSYIYLEDKKENYKDYILEMIEKSSDIREVDVEDLPATINIHPIENSFREDKVEKHFTRSELLKNANNVHEGYILLEKGREEVKNG